MVFHRGQCKLLKWCRHYLPCFKVNVCVDIGLNVRVATAHTDNNDVLVYITTAATVVMTDWVLFSVPLLWDPRLYARSLYFLFSLNKLNLKNCIHEHN